MRIRCQACGAPYFLPDELPPEGAKCPNCDAPAPKAVAIPERPPENPQPQPEDSSRVVAVIAILHLLIAAGGLCIFVGMTSVMGQYGSDSRSRGFALTGAVLAVMWAATGVGLLRRWVGAWAFSLGLIISSLVFLALSVLMGAQAKGNPCGVAFYGLVLVGMLFVLIGRRREFR